MNIVCEILMKRKRIRKLFWKMKGNATEFTWQLWTFVRSTQAQGKMCCGSLDCGSGSTVFSLYEVYKYEIATNNTIIVVNTFKLVLLFTVNCIISAKNPDKKNWENTLVTRSPPNKFQQFTEKNCKVRKSA